MGAVRGCRPGQDHGVAVQHFLAQDHMRDGLIPHSGDVGGNPRPSQQLAGHGVGAVANGLGDVLVRPAGGHAGEHEIRELAVA